MSGRTAAAAALVLLLAMLLVGCGIGENDAITSAEQLNDSRYTIGVDQGSAADLIAQQVFPNAKFEYYTDKFMGYKAVADGKADAFVYDRRQMEIAIENGLSGVHLLEETLGQPVDIAVGISPVSRTEDLGRKLNTFITQLREDGTLDDMYRRWVAEGEDVMPEIPAPNAPTGRLTVGTSGIAEPFSYYGEGGLTGYDIELATRFAAWLNTDLEFKIYDYGSIVAAALSGDVDCIMADLNVTEERRQELPFSDVLFSEEVGVLVRGDGDNTLEYTSLDQMEGLRVGVLTGSENSELVSRAIPTADLQYYNSTSDLYQALKSHKVEAFAEDEVIVEVMTAGDESVGWIPDYLDTVEFAFAFPKDDKSETLCSELSAFVRELSDDGSLNRLHDIWLGPDEELKQPSGYESLPAVNGTLRVAVNTGSVPMVYMKDNAIVGYEVDLLTLFCQRKGYGLELDDMVFSAVLAGVQSGKYDLGAAAMTVTEERSKSVLFSEPHFESGVVLAVRTTGNGEDDGFFRGLAASFEKTFITENRWQLFLIGILKTLIIAVLSILLGTVLGFAAYLLCRSGGRVTNGVTRAAVWLVQAMPVLVFLMVLYYLVFGKVAVSGTVVAVIGFTITFGASVYGMLRSGVETVDKGQTEAAYALGVSSRRTFFDIVLPQAIPHVLPSYRGEIGSLIRGTSIVGYIAVQDLTKMGDIVRSRTFEPFFPLLVVAVIYILMAVLVNWLIGRAIDRIDPRKRGREAILKGVDAHDPDRAS